ncbi:hypothetical protein [uncultured Roseobacter sp.]|uniref:hypothetical protein n=1 Tax=uncultured Roseobacter sp. TaxID=114847 RepID=UPI00263760F1|nr:hypothetical protein [uncultured Roseobacter sp.]
MTQGNTKTSKTKLRPFLLGLVVGAALSWALFVVLYSPTDAQFLRTAYAQYFKKLSDADLSQYGSYGDCRLIEPGQQDQQIGIKKIALCALNMPDGTRRALEIAMTPTANILYTDTEAFSDNGG